MNFEISQHALIEIDRRNISLDLVMLVLERPEQITEERASRRCYQSRLMFPDDKIYLLRLIVDGNKVVTAYKTSKIDKYWRENQ